MQPLRARNRYTPTQPLLTPTEYMRVLNTILLIDDDETTNYLNQRLLRKMNVVHHIQVATNGEEGLQYLREHCLSSTTPTESCPDLIFLDIKMPVMDGFEFLDEYRLLSPLLPAQAIIAMLTSSVSQVDLNRLQQYDSIRKFLNKPLTEASVSEILTQFFSHLTAV